MESPVNEVIANRYELLEVIGQGGQALVFRANDRKTQRHVAVKVMNRGVSQDPQWVERMAREQQAMVALAGTHAVGFVDLCTSPSGALCLVMELLEGKNLEQTLKERCRHDTPIGTPELQQWMSPIVDTLEKAHAVGILHRDLKPANLFLVDTPEGTKIRLLDFGFSRSTTSKQVTQTGTVLGSPSYIAPEMWLGSPDGADQRVDVYSLGVILYQLLSLQLPFGGQTLQEKFIAATTAERPSLHALRPDLPDKVDIWVERALAIDRDERFASVRACWNELLWALDLAPHASSAPPSNDPQNLSFGKIREWLEAPIAVLPNPLAAVRRIAASALRQLKKLTPSFPPSAPLPAPPPTPAQLPPAPHSLPPRDPPAGNSLPISSDTSLPTPPPGARLPPIPTAPSRAEPDQIPEPPPASLLPPTSSPVTQDFPTVQAFEANAQALEANTVPTLEVNTTQVIDPTPESEPPDAPTVLWNRTPLPPPPDPFNDPTELALLEPTREESSIPPESTSSESLGTEADSTSENSASTVYPAPAKPSVHPDPAISVKTRPSRKIAQRRNTRKKKKTDATSTSSPRREAAASRTPKKKTKRSGKKKSTSKKKSSRTKKAIKSPVNKEPVATPRTKKTAPRTEQKKKATGKKRAKRAAAKNGH